MRIPRLASRPSVLSATLLVLVVSGCSDEDSASSPAAAGASAPTSVTAPAVTIEGREGGADEAPPPDASFPASTGDDGGEERRGSSEEGGEDMRITGLRLEPQNGYDRLVIDLDTDGIPFWTARYTEASSAAGDPVEVAGDSFLRLGLFTENSSAEPIDAVLGTSGVVAEVRSTGSLGGYQEVLVGVRGAPAPFRTFGLTDPGRIVVDIRPAG